MNPEKADYVHIFVEANLSGLSTDDVASCLGATVDGNIDLVGQPNKPGFLAPFRCTIQHGHPKGRNFATFSGFSSYGLADILKARWFWNACDVVQKWKRLD